MGTEALGPANWMTHLSQMSGPFLEAGPSWMAADVERHGSNLCVIPMWGRGSRDRGIQNSNIHSSRSGKTSGRGGDEIDGRSSSGIDSRSSKRRRDVDRRRGGRLHTRPVARAVSSVGLGHAWIREWMGRAERFSSSGYFLWGNGNEIN